MKLLQGWLALRKLVMEETISENVRTLLMNLRIPDPNLSPWFYCVQSLPNGQSKLYVIIGFEGPDLQTVSLEEGISAMLNVPQSQLESLLSTSMAPTGDTKRVYNHYSAAIEKANDNVAPKIFTKKSLTRNPVMLALAASTAVVAISIFLLMSGGAKGTNQNNGKSSNQDSSAATQPNELVNAEQVASTTDRNKVSGLETLAQSEAIDPNPPKEMKLDMVLNTKENPQDATDDLKLEMTTGLKSEENGNNTEKSSSADDMIKQMAQ